MLMSFVENWDFLELLRPMVVLILVEAVVLFGWMMLAVVAMNTLLTVALLITGEIILVIIVKMPA